MHACFRLASDKFKFCNTCYLQWESDWVSSRAIRTFLSTQTILSKLQAVNQVMKHSNHAFLWFWVACICFCENQEGTVMTLRQTHTTSNACLLSLGLWQIQVLQHMLSSVGIRLSFFPGHTNLPLNTNYTKQTTSGESSDATQQPCFPMVLGSMYMFLWKPRRDCHDIKANTYNVKCMPAFAWPLTNSSFATHVIFSGNPTEFLPGPYEPSSQHKLY